MRRRKRDRPRLPKSYLASLSPEERRAAMVAALEKTGGSEGKASLLLGETYWVWSHYAGELGIRADVRRIRAALKTRFRIPRTA